MSNTTGLKHVATEPARLEGKRERRRVGSGRVTGRAAALRRAPSDSDCSGETASLSADSGERVVRPAPPPPRTAKSRSRRRGSEWEVLEGLKDGQRFEKRPEVFNGYLHKKRKWPLKGWHKRFFVVDGGILVYARSPADVARGRLHGSVDVGLSVLSAKPRRRRIDIDADEFIYHLRAKTQDLFRTWLAVLKAHRLYRQHLLTFGVRESAPKVTAPLDDLPPTDTSSQSTWNDTSINEDIYFQNPRPLLRAIPSSNSTSRCPPYRIKDKITVSRRADAMNYINVKTIQNKYDRKYSLYNYKSLCSMNCVYGNSKFGIIEENSPMASCDTVELEKKRQDVNLYEDSMNRFHSSLLCQYSINSPIGSNNQHNDSTITQMYDKTLQKNLKMEQTSHKRNKNNNTTAYFFFSCPKGNGDGTQPLIRRSKKSTNLVKYQNRFDEPVLSQPLSNCMLLKKYKYKPKDKDRHEVMSNVISKKDIDVQVNETSKVKVKENDSLQNVITVPEYEGIAEKIMVVMFNNSEMPDELLKNDIKCNLKKIINDLFNLKNDQADSNPIKIIFKCLLDYWLKNSSRDDFKVKTKIAKSIDRQSNKLFATDVATSNVTLAKYTKGTQFFGLSNFKKERGVYTDNTKRKLNNRLSIVNMQNKESLLRESRIQQLEKMLKSTVYICETLRSECFKEKDIKMTKKLIDNLGKSSQKDTNNSDEIFCIKSDSSNELPKIEETINHLLCETSIPPDVAKEFLSAYLDLLHENPQLSESPSSSDESKTNLCQPTCDVQTEPIQKKVSISVTTKEIAPSNNQSKCRIFDADRLKHFLDKISMIFSNIKEGKEKGCSWNNSITKRTDMYTKEMKDIKNNAVPPIDCVRKETDIINDVKILCKEHTQNLPSSPFKNKWLLNTIQNLDSEELFNRNTMDAKCPNKMVDSYVVEFSNNFSDNDCVNIKPYESSNDNSEYKITDKPEIKLCFSESDVTSNGCRVFEDYACNIDKRKDVLRKRINYEEEAQSCFILSLTKGALASKFKSRNKFFDNYANTTAARLSNTHSNYTGLSTFENPPKVMDEKFILLLLENLTLLSKNVPSVYKDINNLYQKLKKRHEKVSVNKPQGLSLLGKIYSEEVTFKNTNDKETQFDETLSPRDLVKKENKSTNICQCTFDEYIINEMTSTTSLLMRDNNLVNDVPKIKTRKDFYKDSDIYQYSSTQTPTFSSISSGLNIVKSDKAISNQNWYRQLYMRDCAVSTIIKTILGNSNSNISKLKNAHNGPMLRDPFKKSKINRQRSGSLRPCFIKQVALLPPPLKSIHCQTEKKLRCLGEKGMNRDFKIYRLFLSNKYQVKKSNSMIDLKEGDDELRTIYRCSTSDPYISRLASPSSPLRGPQAGFVSGTPGGRLASWIIESGGPLDSASRELGQAQLSVQQLQRLLDALDLHQQTHHDTDVSLEGASPNVKKDRRKFGLRKKKSSNKCSSVELAPPQIDPSSSHMALSALTAPPSPGGSASMQNSAASLPIACAATRPQSLPGAEALNAPASLTSLTPDHQLREDFTVLAKDLVASLKTIVATLICERGRLRAAMEAAEPAASPGSLLAALRNNLSSALHQNCELRSRLSRIHDASDLAEMSTGHNSELPRQLASLSLSSSCVSATEFFDAEEPPDRHSPLLDDQAGVIELDGDSTSEAGSLSSEEGSGSSDNSEALTRVGEERPGSAAGAGQGGGAGEGGWGRRSRLPRPRPAPAPPSLWNLLYKNIGKDLSQISMPVTINEPLNMLQRLCEELEYSELLDSAASCTDPIERCALIAAFAVSAYAATAHRAASKPFNPLLAETYECVREDRGFKFIAEQVSHHPPVSACHAASARWVFWQEARIKTKFWGKSMEFQPAGKVHVRLTTTGDHYSWNKVTTCVHNLFGGQRWVDQYGDMTIVCHGTDITCKLNFIKASSWSNSRHEVRGAVCGARSRLRLAGRWSEVLLAGDPPAQRCLWRPGAMAPDSELYYGFTRFAMELNEMTPGLADILPHTDTRHRPDQRALEEGDIEAAERYKLQLEQSQRQRRRDSPEHTPAWFRKTVEEGEETWVFTGEYWSERDNGFPAPRAPPLW